MSGILRRLFREHGRTILAAALLMAVTVWLFWPSTGYGFLNFDDDRYVSGNQVVRKGLTVEGIQWAFRSVYESYWLPVMWLSYMTDATIFGTGPFGFHATNVALHAINAALLFLLLRVMTKRFWVSLFVAALFAWHPLRVESVAWIAERKDVLSGFFFLLSLLCYVSYARRPVVGRDVPAAFMLALGLMTKPMLVTMPFLLLVLDRWPLERWTFDRGSVLLNGWNLIREKVLFWALAVLFCFLTYYTQRVGSAVHDASAYPWLQRIAHIPSAYLFYLGKILYPAHLSMIYGDLSSSTVQMIVAVVVLAIITIAAILSHRRCPAILVGWFWFLGLLVPVIGLVRVGVTHVADRFTYLPSIGLGIAVAWGAVTYVPERAWKKPLMWTVSILILGACMIQTRNVLPQWKDSIVAFENVLRHLPNNGLANNNYGEALLGTGQTEKALKHFEKAMSIDVHTTPFIANSGIALLLLNRADEAIARLEMAVTKIDPTCPFLNFTLGLSWMEKGEPERAIPYLKTANADPMIRPTWRLELARAYMEAGKAAEASNELARVTGEGWGEITTFEGMCTYYATLWSKGHGRRAWTFFQRAIESHPDSVGLLNNVAWLLATDPPAGTTPADAVQLASRARDLCKVVPPNILDTLAVAYAADGRMDEAVRWATEARDLALANQQPALVASIETRLRAYQSGKAWGKHGPADRP